MPMTTIYISKDTEALEKDLKEILYKIDRITGATYQEDMSNASSTYRAGLAQMRANYLDMLDSLLTDPNYEDIVKALGYRK